MTRDALEEGPAGSFPNLPRNPDGTIDIIRLPLGWGIQDGRLIDLVPGNLRDAQGNLLPVPGLAEAEAKAKGRTAAVRARFEPEA